jgi:3-oxoadipate enol-lactonase
MRRVMVRRSACSFGAYPFVGCAGGSLMKGWSAAMEMIVNDVRLNYDDRGSGAAVLLVHGFPLDRSIWDAQVEALAETHRVITPDLRGFGASSFGEIDPASLSLDAYAADLAAMLDALNVETVTFGGLSMGGYIAFAFLRAYAPRVSRLMLLNTRATPDSAEGRTGRFALMDRVREHGARAAADAMLPRMFKATEAEQPALWERTRTMMEAASVPGLEGALQALADRPDSTPDLADIRIPTLVLVGDADVLTPPSEAEAMHRAIAGSRLVTLPDCGHLSTLEQPDAVNQAVKSFLSP